MTRRVESEFILCTDRSLGTCIGAILAGTFCGLAFLGTRGTVEGDRIILICSLVTLAGFLWIPVSVAVRLTCILLADTLDRHPGAIRASLLAIPVGVVAAFLLL
jgi:hypothetical protein